MPILGLEKPFTDYKDPLKRPFEESQSGNIETLHIRGASRKFFNIRGAILRVRVVFVEARPPI